MSGNRIAALDLGGTKIKACLFEDGRPVERAECDTLAREGADKVLERAMGLIAPLAPFAAVGVSTAGQVQPGTGIIRYANENLPGYTGMPVKALFEARFGVPAAVENDVNSAALGEGVKGAAAGERNYLCLTFGTGVGGAIVLSGGLYHGAGGSAGEFGAIVVHPEDVVPGVAFSGCYEHYASATALVEAGKRLDPALSDGRAIFGRLEEFRVRALVDRWLEEVANGLSSLIHIFEPGCVVLGGGVMEQEYAIQGAREHTMVRLMPSFRHVRIVGAQLGNMAGLYGAAKLAEELVQ